MCMQEPMMHANYPHWPHFRVQILLNFAHANEATKTD